MRPAHARVRAVLALVAIACLAAGCMGGSSDRQRPTAKTGQASARVAAGSNDAAATTGAGPPAAKRDGPGALARALPSTCRDELRGLDAAHARDVSGAGSALRARDVAAATLRAIRAQLAGARRDVRAQRRAYLAARKPLEVFLAAHPERVLDPADLAHYQRLQAAHEASRLPYERAIGAYDVLVVRHNGQVERFNALTDRGNALATTAAAAHTRFQRTASRCLARVTRWDARVGPIEARLAASAMAGTSGPAATVSCDSPGTWKEVSREAPTPETYERHGFVRVGDTVIHLGPRACYVLDALLGDPKPRLGCVPREVRRAFPLCVPSRAEAAVALTTLAHEAQHVAGARGEAKAECAAVQTVDEVARALGVSAAAASRLGRFTLRRVTLPPSYRSPECRAGGRLDLEPSTKAWP